MGRGGLGPRPARVHAGAGPPSRALAGTRAWRLPGPRGGRGQPRLPARHRGRAGDRRRRPRPGRTPRRTARGRARRGGRRDDVPRGAQRGPGDGRRRPPRRSATMQPGVAVWTSDDRDRARAHPRAASRATSSSGPSRPTSFASRRSERPPPVSTTARTSSRAIRRPDEPVRVRVTLGPRVQADRVTCYVTTDGADPAGDRGEPTRGTAVALERSRRRLGHPVVGLRGDLDRRPSPASPTGRSSDTASRRGRRRADRAPGRREVAGPGRRGAAGRASARRGPAPRGGRAAALAGQASRQRTPTPWTGSASPTGCATPSSTRCSSIDSRRPATGRSRSRRRRAGSTAGPLRGVIEHLDHIVELGVDLHLAVAALPEPVASRLRRDGLPLGRATPGHRGRCAGAGRRRRTRPASG